MFRIILFTPQIPPNTGDIIRLCANTGADLHLVEPLWFTLDAKSCRRTGLNYHDLANVAKLENLKNCLLALGKPRPFAVTKFATQNHVTPRFAAGDAFLFGAETTGLPTAFYDDLDDSQKISLPIVGGNRSLDLSNAVSIIIYEAWRQYGFRGMASPAYNKGFS